MRSCATGPVSALIKYIDQLGATVTIDRGVRKINITPQHGPTVNLLHDSKRVVADFLETAVRCSILKKFSHTQASDASRRKDLMDIPEVISHCATQQCLEAKKPPLKT